MARLNIMKTHKKTLTAKHRKTKRTQKKYNKPTLIGGSGEVSWREFFMGQRYTKKRNSGSSSHRRHSNSKKSRAGTVHT
jgi:hypothetical protein